MNIITQNQSEAEQFLGSISSDVPVPNERPDMTTGRTSLTDFLGAFYPDENEPINLRAFKPKGTPDTDDNYAMKLVVTRARLKNDATLQATLKTLNNNRGIYFGVNAGGGKKEDIKRINAFFMETDDLSLEEQHAALDASPLPPSVCVQTRKSIHAYWLVAGLVSINEADEIQRRLIAHFKSDSAIKDASRVMRLPYYDHLHCSTDSNSLERKRVKIVEFSPDRRYTVEQMQAAFSPVRDVPDTRINTGSQSKSASTKQFYKTHTEYKEELIKRISQDSTAKLKKGWIEVQGKCHGGKGTSGVGVNISTQAVFCHKGCDYSIIARAWNMPEWVRPEQSENIEVEQDQPIPPPKLDDAALHGLAGEFINFIREDTESDHAAVLVQFLIAFGSYIGRNAYMSLGSISHYTNMNAIVVGDTSTGRKGTSLSDALRPFKLLDPAWKKDNVKLGLSTGEGLINCVRDPVIKEVPVEDKNGNPTGAYKQEVIDKGISDKRLLVTETEFASVLKRQGKDGNTLSAIIRQSWDDGGLSTLTKFNSQTATNAHISIIGHISPEELKTNYDRTDAYNGYLNRFIFVCSERSRLLPRGGKLRDNQFSPLVEKLRAAADFAGGIDAMLQDSEAEKMWDEVYAHLSGRRYGTFGGVTARATAQVLRLSCIYALLDQSPVINKAHIRAALALWDYCDASARYIFGVSTGNPIADTILKGLREAGDTGLTRSEISNTLFTRNVDAHKLSEALKLLHKHELARVVKELNADSKRPVKRWFAKTSEKIVPGVKLPEIIEGVADEVLNSSNSFDSTESRPAYMAVVEHE